MKIHFPQDKRYTVAFSGGVDSTVLIDLCKLHKPKLVYINYLRSSRHEEREHVVKYAKKLKLSLDIYDCTCNNMSNGRKFKYKILAQYAKSENDFILTAHHLYDQWENIVLQSMRGSHPNGWLIPQLVDFYNGYIYRPLLDFTKEDIYDYAYKHNLPYVHDPFNDDLTLSKRNIVRQCIPIVSQAHKHAWRNFQHSVNLFKQQNEIYKEAQSKLIDQLRVDNNSLDLKKLKRLPEERILSIMHIWLKAYKVRLTRKGNALFMRSIRSKENFKIDYNKHYYLIASSNTLRLVPKSYV